MVEHDSRLVQIEKSIEEIKDTLNKITIALLGSYDKQSVGLLEESRALRKEVDDLKATRKLQEEQIEGLLEFKRDAKKIVAAIAFVIPFAFEILKVGWTAFWEYIKQAK
jgi:hypothetical protein